MDEKTIPANELPVKTEDMSYDAIFGVVKKIVTEAGNSKDSQIWAADLLRTIQALGIMSQDGESNHTLEGLYNRLRQIQEYDFGIKQAFPLGQSQSDRQVIGFELKT